MDPKYHGFIILGHNYYSGVGEMYSFRSLYIRNTLTAIYYSFLSHIILHTFFCLISYHHVTFFPDITVFVPILCNDSLFLTYCLYSLQQFT